uniref:uncharacterized protein LOC101243453 isoform X3 n=1 Tax=Ciona intestinalis TaxID=7719 RepID=UPI000EF4946F|nr:uncharacterized protein LOC101243453 isoform X3 [Ciona intestinalis]|eukprot:XP_026696516.1 uncharacterized protein LOC101243453 isoform X3 [Ciona intestinalis]
MREDADAGLHGDVGVHGDVGLLGADVVGSAGEGRRWGEKPEEGTEENQDEDEQLEDLDNEEMLGSMNDENQELETEYMYL